MAPPLPITVAVANHRVTFGHGELAGCLVHGTQLVQAFLEQDPRPVQMARVVRSLRALWRAAGRTLMAWVLNR